MPGRTEKYFYPVRASPSMSTSYVIFSASGLLISMSNATAFLMGAINSTVLTAFGVYVSIVNVHHLYIPLPVKVTDPVNYPDKRGLIDKT